jgi:DNA-binding MarR family transcriptional regulator
MRRDSDASIIDVYTSKRNQSTSLCACTAVKKLSRLLGRAYDAALAPSGINVTQFAVMRCISRRNGEPLARVAEELEMDRTSLYRAIAPMERDGWIKLAAGTDARSRSAIVTRKGAGILAKAAGNWDQIQGRLIGSFGKKEWRAFASELQRLGDCAGEVSGKVDRTSSL